MKRSEMEQLIQNHIDEAQENYGASSTYFGNQISVDLLDKILRAGMLPPPKELENVTALVKYYRPFDEIDEDVTYHTNPSLFWEAEDVG